MRVDDRLWFRRIRGKRILFVFKIIYENKTNKGIYLKGRVDGFVFEYRRRDGKIIHSLELNIDGFKFKLFQKIYLL